MEEFKCVEGDGCGVHYRQNSSIIEEEFQACSMVTYIGEYAVMTGDNPTAAGAMGALASLLGVKVPRYCSWVIYVGDKTIHEATVAVSPEETRKAIRYDQVHDNWDNVVTEHDALVMGVEHGLLDVSKSPYA